MFKALHVDGNPMKTIRRDILQRGTVELMKFLRYSNIKLLFREITTIAFTFVVKCFFHCI